MESESLKLSELRPTDSAIVKAVEGEKRIRRRLLDMGITPGTEVYIRKVAPLGDPIEITIRGYELSLRKSEAESVSVEKK
jgi:ferrous iron transport protein A